jgi:prevent-host-death family protein
MATVGTGDLQGLKIVNIHEAKTHLSRLVEEAAHGKSFIIAKAGEPMVRVTRLQGTAPVENQPSAPKQRIGMLEGMYEVPEDFDTMFQEEIIALFNGEEWRFC